MFFSLTLSDTFLILFVFVLFLLHGDPLVFFAARHALNEHNWDRDVYYFSGVLASWEFFVLVLSRFFLFVLVGPAVFFLGRGILFGFVVSIYPLFSVASFFRFLFSISKA